MANFHPTSIHPLACQEITRTTEFSLGDLCQQRAALLLTCLFLLPTFGSWRKKVINQGLLLIKDSFRLQLWEQAQLDNAKLRDDLTKTRDELKSATKKIDSISLVRDAILAPFV